jgi:GDP/UDP-N,N'-diacetylbacillosamine 2-epimerase (hydrolysing)
MINLLLVGMSRADYWLMKSLFLNINNKNDFKINFLVSKTLVKDLENENKEEFDNINMLDGINILRYENFDNSVETFFSIQKEFNDLLEVNNFDLVIVLGDRYETLAIAQVAFLRGIDVAHISGGETTFGSKDNEFRKCISLYSKLHFPARKDHATELGKLGIDMKDTKIVGYMAIDTINMYKKQFMNKRNLLDKLAVNTDYEISVVTYHPNTKNPNLTAFELEILITFMESIEKTFFVITAANNDDGGSQINKRMLNWTLNNKNKSKFFYHLGSRDYFNLLIHANCLVGNSSSGLTEASILNVPVVNIGDRQLGRHKEANVYDCDFTVEMITKQYSIASKVHSKNSKAKADDSFISPSSLIVDSLKNFYSLGTDK